MLPPRAVALFSARCADATALLDAADADAIMLMAQMIALLPRYAMLLAAGARHDVSC